jgi:bacterioferritin (cytochrome b1)
MHKLAARNAAMVLDLLSGRMVFERTGVKLYDSIIHKIDRRGEERYHVLLPTLRHHRDEEQEHAEWLSDQIRMLGGNPEEKTDFAELEAEESTGIQSVMLDGHNKVPHLIHALLSAELADNAGWDLLVKLAGDAGDGEARREFMKRMAEEAKHLVFIREAMIRAAEIEILGQRKEMPRGVAAAAASTMAKPIGLGVAVGGLLGVAGTAAWAMGLRRGASLGFGSRLLRKVM